MKKLSIDIEEENLEFLKLGSDKIGPYINEIIKRYRIVMRHAISSLADDEIDSISKKLPKSLDILHAYAFERLDLKKSTTKKILKLGLVSRISLLNTIEQRRRQNG